MSPRSNEPYDDRLDLGPLMSGEAVARSFKARTGYRCVLCNGWISRGQQTVITTCLRTAHAGCFIDARSLRDGQPRLPFPRSS